MKDLLISLALAQLTDGKIRRVKYNMLWFYFCLVVKQDNDSKLKIKQMIPPSNEGSSSKNEETFISPAIKSLVKHRIVDEKGGMVPFS